MDGDKYDIVLIDCPPNFNIVTKTAIVASNYILVPARPDYLSTMGIDYLIRSVNELIDDYNEFAELGAGGESGKDNPQNIRGGVYNDTRISRRSHFFPATIHRSNKTDAWH